VIEKQVLSNASSRDSIEDQEILPMSIFSPMN